ncbi:hypothetical protein PV726_38330 [Streptomyces europaeiscabiei]|uniref:hypothetical protein n=1 Tax=Streptomyces europaeiscabiei TaxID=146819 RepID=UPI0029BBCABE|nr:hypothetical protein [Streptomyces europaeiscabiei]MDX3696076.1 hypothetical protein [Streptomyces europaeiscabiei]
MVIKQWSDGGVDHHTLLRFAPQTFAYAWNDAPVGQLARMMQKFEDFLMRDYDRDLFLTNVALYWLTGTSGTSSWFMYNRREFAWPQGQQYVPTASTAGRPRSVASPNGTIGSCTGRSRTRGATSWRWTSRWHWQRMSAPSSTEFSDHSIL